MEVEFPGVGVNPRVFCSMKSFAICSNMENARATVTSTTIVQEELCITCRSILNRSRILTITLVHLTSLVSGRLSREMAGLQVNDVDILRREINENSGTPICRYIAERAR